VALKCIFLALQGCHALQWAINDIRWPNIIFVADIHGGKWWLIDCEHAQKFDSVFPRIRTYAVNPGHVCNASSDLALVAALFVEVQEIVQGSDDFDPAAKCVAKLKTAFKNVCCQAFAVAMAQSIGYATIFIRYAAGKCWICCCLPLATLSVCKVCGSGDELAAQASNSGRAPICHKVVARQLKRVKTG